MSILHAKSRFQPMVEMEILSTEIGNLNQEGMALVVRGFEGGRVKIGPSTGVDETMFAGLSYGVRFGSPNRLPRIESKTSFADGVAAKVLLDRAPVTGTVLVLAGSTGYGAGTRLSEINSGTPTNTQFKIDPVNPLALVLHPDFVGADVFVVFQYVPSLPEARHKFGDVQPGLSPHAVTGTIGVITQGHIYTDMYDTSKDWSAADTFAAGEVLKAGANGRLTYGSASGADLRGLVQVYELPTMDQPYLGVWVTRE